jgi:putative transposase
MQESETHRTGLQPGEWIHKFPEIDKRRISSTNGGERIIREIRRRSRVVGVFPTRNLMFVS